MATNLVERIVINGEPHRIDYAKLENRPFGIETIEVLVEPTDMTFDNYDYYDLELGDIDVCDESLSGVSVGDTLTVSVDGVSHDYVTYYLYGYVSLGDDPDDIETLHMGIYQGGYFIVLPTAGVHTIGVSRKNFSRIDRRYLPDCVAMSDTETLLVDENAVFEEVYEAV